MMKLVLAAVTGVLLAGSAHAQTTQTLGFDGPSGLFSPTTEGAYTYSSLNQGVFRSSNGNPGAAIENSNSYPGELDVSAISGGLFNFNSIDFSYRFITEPFSVSGFLNNVLVGTDTIVNLHYSNTSAFVTHNAVTLKGLTVDQLKISLPSDHHTDARFDNLKLTSVVAAVPEPATWAMMIVGFGLVGGAMRRRKSLTATRVSYAV